MMSLPQFLPYMYSLERKFRVYFLDQCNRSFGAEDSFCQENRKTEEGGDATHHSGVIKIGSRAFYTLQRSLARSATKTERGLIGNA